MPLISVLGHACLDKLWLQPSSHCTMRCS
jgi:hypothetical protein